MFDFDELPKLLLLAFRVDVSRARRDRFHAVDFSSCAFDEAGVPDALPPPLFASRANDEPVDISSFLLAFDVDAAYDDVGLDSLPSFDGESRKPGSSLSANSRFL